MKAQREAADKAMSAKLRKLGAQGNKKFTMKDRAYGGKAYATGGGVMGDDLGGDIGGGAPKPNLSKPARAGVKGKKPGGKGGKGKTNVNVIVMGGGAGPGGPGGPPDMGPKPPMMPPGPPMMPPGGPGGGPPLPPPKPPMPGGPAGGPPMPMRKFGGRVKMGGAAKPVGKGKRGC